MGVVAERWATEGAMVEEVEGEGEWPWAWPGWRPDWSMSPRKARREARCAPVDSAWVYAVGDGDGEGARW